MGATGSDLHYQWLKDNESVTEGSKYIGTRIPTLTVIDVMESDEGGYLCNVTNLVDTALSNVAILSTRKYNNCRDSSVHIVYGI